MRGKTKQRWRIARGRLTAFDAVLCAAGLLGLALYFWLLPSQHPDSAADYGLGEARAAEIARAFAEANGVRLPDDTQQEVRLDRHDMLVDSLQRALTRPAATALLKTDARERLPAYYWRVEWQEPGDEDEADYDVDVRLTEGGAVYAYEVEGEALLGEARVALDREALAYALGETLDAPPADGPAGGRLAAVPDSLLPRLARRLSFRFAPADSATGDGAPGGPPAPDAPPAEASPVDLVEAIDPLSRGEAVRLARHHLRRTALRAYAFRVDSAWTEAEVGEPRTATVRLWGDAFHGQRPRVDVRVAATGTLLGLETDFDPEDGAPPAADTAAPATAEAEAAEAAEEESDEDGFSISIEGGTVFGIVTGVFYVLLAGASMFIFFRRVTARVVDTRSALRDALWGGFFAGGFVAMLIGAELAEAQGEDFWGLLVGLMAGTLFTAAGGAFLIFLASGAMDSVARAAWPEKLHVLSLVRHGALRNVPTGRALLAGLAGACLLLGGTTLLLWLFPEALLEYGSLGDGPSEDDVLSLFGFTFGWNAWVTLFLCLTVLLGIGTWLYRRRPSAFFVIAGLALALTLAQADLTKVTPLGFNVGFIGFNALVIAAVFWRYDFVAAFAAYLLAGVAWALSEGWMVAGSPMALDAALTGGSALFVGLAGAAGLLSGRTSTEVPAYVPSYITELAEEERLKRDIEIAQEVQRSFLPRKMPQVEGLDIAAMCLPAQDVGGDYYDFVETGPGRLAIAIGDVSGKGIQAAFYMTLAKGFLQTLAREGLPPAEVLRRLNVLFCQNAPRGTFISMIYGVVDVEKGTFTFARAGHNPLIYKRSPEKAPEFIRPKGMAIGLTNGERFDAQIAEVSVTLQPGDALVFYTDGFSEAMNTAGEQFGDERLARCVGDAAGRTAGEILRAVSGEVHLYVEAAGRHDDMTMVVVKRNGGAKPPAASPPAAVRKEQRSTA